MTRRDWSLGRRRPRCRQRSYSAVKGQGRDAPKARGRLGRGETREREPGERVKGETSEANYSRHLVRGRNF